MHFKGEGDGNATPSLPSHSFHCRHSACRIIERSDGFRAPLEPLALVQSVVIDPCLTWTVRDESHNASTSVSTVGIMSTFRSEAV